MMRLFFIGLLLLLNITVLHAQPCGTYSVSFDTEDEGRIGRKVEHVIYPVRDSTALYLRMDNHYDAFVDKMSAAKERYVIKFTDGTTYRYDQPFHTKYVVCDLAIILKGWTLRFDIDTNGNKLNRNMAAGDTVLFGKLLKTPVQSIRFYSASWKWHNGGSFGDYEGGYELPVPKQKAIELMQAIQCLVKNTTLPPDPIEKPGGLKLYHEPPPNATRIKVTDN